MNLYKLSDKIVFSILKDINKGYLEIVDYDGELFTFGNKEDHLKAYLKIKTPGFTYNLIKGGSIGFAEAYMRDEFETNNLSNLIEITAKNINKVHKISGILDVPFFNYFKNYFFKIFKPADTISVIIDQYQSDEKILYASQDGKRVDFTTTELLKSYLKHPLMTFKIISAIHFEAFKLWAKGIKLVKRKLKIIYHLKTNEFV